ncbi:hypothetical protein [Pleomorphomonas sp. PLEO]|uniref:hypothetical protein n=1 Tax=Pleomorphomonas sp. PLEO TaxID=3239306 RepID=UPI00351F75DD
MDRTVKAVPYFSQWETPEMTLPVVAEGEAALLNDPLWAQSGAETVREYAHWAVNLCGMACLKMILAACGAAHPTLELARVCTQYGGYVVGEDGKSIKGLIYAPFVRMASERFGLRAEVVTGLETAALPELLARWPFFMASVHHGIRWPDREPPSKGGHLVLVTAATPDAIRFHNPSGHDRASQADVLLTLTDFDRFFANRGIALGF